MLSQRAPILHFINFLLIGKGAINSILEQEMSNKLAFNYTEYDP